MQVLNFKEQSVRCEVIVYAPVCCTRACVCVRMHGMCVVRECVVCGVCARGVECFLNRSISKIRAWVSIQMSTTVSSREMFRKIKF